MDALSINAGGPTAAGGVRDRGLKTLSSEDFFRILVTELQQQDPLEPSKTGDMISQVADIRNIELSTQLSTSLARLAETQQRAGVSDLIGKLVRAEVDLGNGQKQQVEGVVTGVRFVDNGVTMLELDTGESIPANSIRSVGALPLAGPDALLAGSTPDSEPNATDEGETDKSGETSRWLDAFRLPRLSYS